MSNEYPSELEWGEERRASEQGLRREWRLCCGQINGWIMDEEEKQSLTNAEFWVALPTSVPFYKNNIGVNVGQLRPSELECIE